MFIVITELTSGEKIADEFEDYILAKRFSNSPNYDDVKKVSLHETKIQDGIVTSKVDLINCIKNLMAYIDNPIMRRKLTCGFLEEARTEARAILKANDTVITF